MPTPKREVYIKGGWATGGGGWKGGKGGTAGGRRTPSPQRQAADRVFGDPATALPSRDSEPPDKKPPAPPPPPPKEVATSDQDKEAGAPLEQPGPDRQSNCNALVRLDNY